MKFSFARLFIPLLLILAIDIYVFQAVRVVSPQSNQMARRIIMISYWVFTGLAIFLVLSASLANWHDWPKFIKTYLFGIVVIVYFSKIVVRNLNLDQHNQCAR